MRLPLVNATLTVIAGGGGDANYDTPAGADLPKWEGEEDAYVVEELVEVQRDDSVDELQRTSIVITAERADGVERGDTLTYSYRGQTHTREVRDLRVAVLAGTARLVFTDQ
jgi:hypothetical protein